MMIGMVPQQSSKDLERHMHPALLTTKAYLPIFRNQQLLYYGRPNSNSCPNHCECE